MNEEEVIQAVLQGNVERYAEVVNAYQGIVADLCYRLGVVNDDVEEMTQRVFVALYTSLPRFKFRSKLSTFIYRITVNTVSKERRHLRRMVSASDTTELNYMQSTEPNAEQAIIQEETYRQLHKAIGKLKDEQRTALVLYTFDDFSYADIAAVMECTTAKVESLIFRARKNLRKMLEYVL